MSARSGRRRLDNLKASWRQAPRENVLTNLLRDLPDAATAEVFTALLERPGCRIERIVSRGQTTPEQAPYRQAHEEWVLLLKGAARIALKGARTG